MYEIDLTKWAAIERPYAVRFRAPLAPPLVGRPETFWLRKPPPAVGYSPGSLRPFAMTLDGKLYALGMHERELCITLTPVPGGSFTLWDGKRLTVPSDIWMPRSPRQAVRFAAEKLRLERMVQPHRGW